MVACSPTSPDEAQPRLNLEGRAPCTQTLGKFVPRGPLQDDAKMRYRDLVSVDTVVVGPRSLARIEVCDQLMAEEIKIDPF